MVRDPPPKGGREPVARPTDRAIGCDPASMARVVREPPESEFARATEKRAAGPPTRSGKAGRHTSSDDNTWSPAYGGCRPNVARSGR